MDELKEYLKDGNLIYELDVINGFVEPPITALTIYDIKKRKEIDALMGFAGMDISENGMEEYINMENVDILGQFNSIEECIGYLYLNHKIS